MATNGVPPLQVRLIRREVTQELVLPIDSDMPIKERCEQALVKRLHRVPSEWGIMINDHLESISLGEYSRVLSFGTKIYVSVPLTASYMVVGYIPGDVLLDVSIADRMSEDTAIRAFRSVDILGLPFQISVKTTLDARSMNIQIVEVRVEGSLQYIAKPAYYAHYAPILAGLCQEDASRLYGEVPEPDLPSNISQLEYRLIDPLHGDKPNERIDRVVKDVKRVAAIEDTTSMNAAMNASTSMSVAKSTAAPMSTISPQAIFGDGPRAPKTLSKNCIEFISIEDVAALHKSAGTASHTFVRVPSMPPFSTVVAVVSPTAITPTDAQVSSFIEDVRHYIKFKKFELLAHRSIYGVKHLKTRTATPESAMLEEHLRAGELIVNTLVEPPQVKQKGLSDTLSAARRDALPIAEVEGERIRVTTGRGRGRSSFLRMIDGSTFAPGKRGRGSGRAVVGGPTIK